MGKYNDNTKLINEEIPYSDGIQTHKSCAMLRSYYFLIVSMIIISIIFQGISFFYLYEIGTAAKDIDIYTVNQTETHEYINKLKKIINYICVHEGIC
jgi:hypothetical protein